MFPHIFKKIKQGVQNPKKAVNVFLGLIRGTFCILYYRIKSKNNVKIGFPFYVYQKVTIKGPGKVSIGRSCSVYPNDFHGLAIITCTSHAEVTIGPCGSIGGLTIVCYEKISIGKRLMTAKSFVQDTFLQHRNVVKSSLKSHDLNRIAPVIIGDNVWLAAQSYVLRGSSIGNDSVLSNGSVCFDKNSGFFRFCAGNPVKKDLPIKQLLLMRGP